MAAQSSRSGARTRGQAADGEVSLDQRILESAEALVRAVLDGEMSVEQAAEKFDIPVWEAWAIALEAGVRRDAKTGALYVEEREAHPEATLRRVGLKAPRPFPREQKPVFTDEELKAAVKEYEAGASLKTLSVKHGASPTTVRKYLLRAGAKVREPGRRGGAATSTVRKTATQSGGDAKAAV